VWQEVCQADRKQLACHKDKRNTTQIVCHLANRGGGLLARSLHAPQGEKELGGERGRSFSPLLSTGGPATHISTFGILSVTVTTAAVSRIVKRRVHASAGLTCGSSGIRELLAYLSPAGL